MAYQAEKLFRQKKYKKALRLYDTVIRKSEAINDITFLDMYYSSRAKINMHLNNYKKSLNDINKAINLKPKTYLYFFERYEIKEKFKDLTGAQEDLNTVFKILQQNNSEHIFKMFLASLKMREKKYLEAADLLKNTDGIQYNNEKINTIKLELYGYLGDKTNLLATIDKLINIFPQRISYWDCKLNLYIELKEYKKAFMIIEKILSIEPDNEKYKTKKKEIEQIIQNNKQ